MMGEEGGWQDWPGKWNTKAMTKAASSNRAGIKEKDDKKAAAAPPQQARGTKRDSKEAARLQPGQRRSKRTRAGG